MDGNYFSYFPENQLAISCIR